MKVYFEDSAKLKFSARSTNYIFRTFRFAKNQKYGCEKTTCFMAEAKRESEFRRQQYFERTFRPGITFENATECIFVTY